MISASCEAGETKWWSCVHWKYISLFHADSVFAPGMYFQWICSGKGTRGECVGIRNENKDITANVFCFEGDWVNFWIIIGVELLFQFWVSEKVEEETLILYSRLFPGNKGIISAITEVREHTLSVVWPCNQVLMARATATKERVYLQQSWHFALRSTLGFQACSILGLQNSQENAREHCKFSTFIQGFCCRRRFRDLTQWVRCNANFSPIETFPFFLHHYAGSTCWQHCVMMHSRCANNWRRLFGQKRLRIWCVNCLRVWGSPLFSCFPFFWKRGDTCFIRFAIPGILLKAALPQHNLLDKKQNKS